MVNTIDLQDYQEFLNDQQKDRDMCGTTLNYESDELRRFSVDVENKFLSLENQFGEICFLLQSLVENITKT